MNKMIAVLLCLGLLAVGACAEWGAHSGLDPVQPHQFEHTDPPVNAP